jgi:alpha-L-fucosidase 2
MKTRFQIIFSFVLISVLSVMGSFCNAQVFKLLYTHPAMTFNEALPVGNGRVAAMVWGGTARERIQLNEETFWGGSPYNNNNPNARKKLDEVRSLIFANKMVEAQDLVQKNFFTGRNGMSYHTAGDLCIDFPGHDQKSGYSRDLDLNRAVATTTYAVGGVKFTREVFTSFTNGTLIVRITADHPHKLNFRVSYNTPFLTAKMSHHGNVLILNEKGADQDGVPGKVKLALLTEAKVEGGQVSTDDKCISVSNATVATLYVATATNFVNYKDVSGNEMAKASKILAKAVDIPYEEALASHVKYYKNQFDRVKLKLGNDEAEKLPTINRLRDYQGKHDASFVALLFQYGRYLLISSSQPGCQPANLQGKWNDMVMAPWDSKYTININTEMNYWPAEVTNLTETHQPLFAMIHDLSETGRITAQTMYGCKGWVVHHNTDLWRFAGPIDGAFYGMWPNGGGWLSTHLWQHYLFTGDRSFLSKVFPELKGAADFYMSSMVRHPKYGWYVTAPSMSPEHGPTGSTWTLTAGCTMDNQIAFDVLNQALAASKILNYSTSYQDSLKSKIDQLPPMQIGKYNQLQEWLEDSDDPTDQHRHISHAYGIFPSSQISPYRNPELFQAVKNTLIQRGDEATGWSIGWKINIWARMLDGNHAFRIVNNFLKLLPNDSEYEFFSQGRLYPNLLDSCPPFQIDGNFGFTSGIAEMLLQSQDGAVHILPALPDEWENGEVSGLVARGGFVVGMKWDHGQISTVNIHSRLGGNIRIRSYVPLKGVGLSEAKGENPNPFYMTTAIKTPLVAASLHPQYPILKKVFEYDLSTTAGGDYQLERR